MKNWVLGGFVFIFAGMANAAAGFALGHSKWASDGMPEIGPNEQASVFFCVQSGTGQAAAQCALEKCLKKFKKEDLCEMQGYQSDPGYTVVVLGAKGNNQFIYSGGFSKISRAEAIKRVVANNFPLSGATYVADFYESGGTVVHNLNHSRQFKAGTRN